MSKHIMTDPETNEPVEKESPPDYVPKHQKWIFDREHGVLIMRTGDD